NDLVLFAHWQMRLTIFMGLVVEICRILATQACLDIEIMGLPSTLIHEVLTQLQIALLPGDPRQFHQREFDLFMSRVTAPLSLLRAEDGIDVICIATQRIQQNTFPRSLEMSHCRLDQMAGTIQLMPITQVRPALLRLDNREID